MHPSCSSKPSSVISWTEPAPDTRPLFSATALRRFATTLEIPKNVQVWTASVRSETRHGTLRMRYKNTPPGAVNGFQLYVFTYSVGFFGEQITIGRWTSSSNRKSFPFALVADRIWEEFSAPLWPVAHVNHDWPLRSSLTDQLLEALCDRWRKVAVPQIAFHRLAQQSSKRF